MCFCFDLGGFEVLEGGRRPLTAQTGMCHSPFTVIAGVWRLLELYDKSAVRLVESGE